MGDVSRIRVTGPLEPYVSGFVAELVERGYTSVSAAHQLRLMAALPTPARGVGGATCHPPIRRRGTSSRSMWLHGIPSRFARRP